MGALQLVTALLRQLLKIRVALAAENLTLRHQILILQRSVKRLRLHRRDRIYGSYFANRVRGVDIEEVLIAPRSPWQSPYVERLIGSIRTTTHHTAPSFYVPEKASSCWSAAGTAGC